MTLPNPFEDERIQFFLRNREDIKAWAAIEPDAMAATRELLTQSQSLIEERLAALDDHVLVSRHDSSPWERILSRRAEWPESVGVTLEWHKAVDPLGGNRPKLGVFWWADPPALEAPRARLATVVDAKALQAAGYKVPMSGVWPVGMYAVAQANWWRDPERWVATLIDHLAAAWPLVAPRIDEVLGVERRVIDG
jgi:hypothetical protein